LRHEKGSQFYFTAGFGREGKNIFSIPVICLYQIVFKVSHLIYISSSFQLRVAASFTKFKLLEAGTHNTSYSLLMEKWHSKTIKVIKINTINCLNKV